MRTASPCSSRSRPRCSSKRCAAAWWSASTTRRICGRCSATRANPTPKAATSRAASTTSTGSEPGIVPATDAPREDTMAAKYELSDDGVVVIIGSGAGGGTLANELAQKGLKVVCLEAGARHDLTDFVNNEWEMFSKISWLDKRTPSGSWRVAKDFPNLPA